MINNIKKNFLFLKKRENLKGFTLVETLVAISILMLAITGPLYFSSESLKAATYSRDQITSFYLAQDAFEQIRKIRDDNLSVSNNWYDGLDNCNSNTCRVNSTAFYSVDTSFGGCNINDPCADLYLQSDGTYSHDSTRGGVKTAFSRVVKIEPNDGTSVWGDATEMKITVTISWMSGTISRNFTAYEFLRKLGA